MTVGQALENYSGLLLAQNLRTATERRRQLEHGLYRFMKIPLFELTRTDLQKIIDDKALSAPFAANRLRAALSAFLGWCWQRGYVESNFALATTRACREVPRERVLSCAELKAIHAACDQMGLLWGPFITILLHTAQRRGDVAQMEWCQIKLSERRWEIPGKNTKNRQPHIVHLSDPCLDALHSLMSQRDSSNRFVFTTTGTAPVSGFGRMKKRLDILSGVEDWRLHDMRTSFATHLAESGIDEGVVDRVLNHIASASSASTVARVYNRAHRLKDRALALDHWASYLAPTINQKCLSHNVVSLYLAG